MVSELKEDWDRVGRDLMEVEIFDGVVAIYDVDSSFIGDEMNTALTLSMLVASVSKAPFVTSIVELLPTNRSVINFSYIDMHLLVKPLLCDFLHSTFYNMHAIGIIPI